MSVSLGACGSERGISLLDSPLASRMGTISVLFFISKNLLINCMMEVIVSLIDRVLSDPENEANIAAVRAEVNAMMEKYPLFAW